MKNKKGKIIVSIISFIILVAGIAVGTFLVQQNQDIREEAAPATSVYISPSTQNKNPGNNFTVFAKMDTGENQINGIDIRILFNNDLIEITSIEKGSGIEIFTYEQTKTFDNATGQINYVAAAPGNSVNGTAIEILVINGKVKNDASGTATFTFDPSSVISSMNETQNVIISSIPGTITITSGEVPTNTPTTTATTTPTTTATNRATTTATATTRATATATSTTKATTTSTARSTSTARPATTSTPTPFPVPETGNSIPTILSIGLGVLVIFGSLLLAL